MKDKKLTKIGKRISDIRETKGLTQAKLAEKLNTTQSVVARIEKGEQNISTETLSNISDVLNKPIINLADSSLNFRIEGGKKLSGTVVTKTSKNGAVGLLCASLLNKGKTTLKNVPKI